MTIGLEVRVRQALLTDRRQIASLMQYSQLIHRHLDWRYPLDWLGTPPFYILESQERVVSALACPPDPTTIAWIRLFANSGKMPLEESWNQLWQAARLDLSDRGSFTVAAIVLQDWYHSLLLDSGFATRQSIVMLERVPQDPIAFLPVGYTIRPMLQSDLPAVAAVDAAAFDRLWQNSLPSLERAYPQAVLASVAEAEGKMLGYQLSTRNPLGAHLARLAVQPAQQGRGIGRALIADLVHQADQHAMFHLTVNTQDDNAASLALYLKTGFRETGEHYPVYQFQIS